MTGRVEITCVIPTHYRHELLRESMRSVLEQETRRTFELVVVDDTGSAETAAVVTAAAQNSSVSVRYCASDQNGASASRNRVLSFDSGELLAFLDDDDLWDKRFLESMADALSASDADMAVAWLNVLDRDGEIAPLFRIPASLTAAQAAAWNVGFTGSNFMIKKSAFAALGGFDTELPVSNDKDFFLRFLLEGFQYTVAPNYLAIHRRHAGPQLTRGNERRAAGMETYLRKHRSVMSMEGRRYVRQRIHRIRLHTSPTRRQRFYHLIGYVANLSASDVKSKWRRRDGRYAAVR